MSKGVRERLLDRLAASGALVKKGTILGFIPRTTWPAGDLGGRGGRTAAAAGRAGRGHHPH